MKKSKNWPLPIGAHWERTSYPPLYQLSRRVETATRELRDRQKRGWAPLRKHIDELREISIQLKVLDRESARGARLDGLPTRPETH
jgi:hypothetical protein